jgi:hypothetical protein
VHNDRPLMTVQDHLMVELRIDMVDAAKRWGNKKHAHCHHSYYSMEVSLKIPSCKGVSSILCIAG